MDWSAFMCHPYRAPNLCHLTQGCAVPDGPAYPGLLCLAPPGFCRFAAVVDMVGWVGGRCGRQLMCVVLAAQRASNIEAQGERSEALGEAYNNFEPR